MKAASDKSNYSVNKLLNQLFGRNANRNKDIVHSNKVVNEAIELYHSVEETKNHYLINTFCKILFHFKHPEKIMLIWDDINTVMTQQQTNGSSGISYPLLINVFGLCSLDKSQEIFASIPQNQMNIKTVNSMMNALINNQRYQIALNLYDSIGTESNLHRDRFSHILALKACGNLHDINKGVCIHQSVINTVEYDNDIALKTTLIDFYGNCDEMEVAIDVFNSVEEKHRDIPFNNAMMTAYIHNDRNQDALLLYDECCLQCVVNNTSHLLAIKACTNMHNLAKGRHIHYYLKQVCFDLNILNALIDFYGVCDDIDAALDVFHAIDDRKKDIVSINSMMKILILNHRYQECLDLYHSLDTKYTHLQKDEITYSLGIKAYINQNEYKSESEGNIEHLIPSDLMDTPHIKSALIDLFGHEHKMDKALQVFELHYDNNNVVVFNSMLNAYIHNHQYSEALHLFQHRMADRHRNDVSYMLVIKACLDGGQLVTAKEIADSVIVNEHTEIELIHTMIKCYGECLQIDRAEKLFAMIPTDRKDVFTFGCMMTAYIHNEMSEKALELYNQCESKNDICHLLAIQACTKLSDFDQAEHIHNEIAVDVKNMDIAVQNALIDMYGKAGDIVSALRVFDDIDCQKKDISTFNSMMDAYCHNNMNMECIELFRNIKQISPSLEADAISYVIVLKACTNATALKIGQQIHQQLRQHTELNGKETMLNNTLVQIGLINFYGKCAMLDICDEIFNDIKADEPDKYLHEAGIWNAMIHAYGRNSALLTVQRLYSEMEAVPDYKTYTALLSAFGHCGDVKAAQNVWHQQISDETVRWNKHVVNAYIDCCARNGLIEETYDLIMNHENEIDEIGWMSLLSASVVHGELPFIQSVYDQMKNKFNDENNHQHRQIMASASILLANIHGTTA